MFQIRSTEKKVYYVIIVMKESLFFVLSVVD